jgi:hypothetical protein
MDIMKRDRPEAVKNAQWADVVAVAREIKEHEAVLLAEPGPAVEEAPEGMACRTWRTADGKTHLLVCNTKREPVEGAVRVGGEVVRLSLPPIGVVWR